MTKEEFSKTIVNGVSLLSFYAEWCQPCKMLGKTLESFKEKHTEVNVLHLDVEENDELAQEFQVTSIPVTFFIVDGEIKERVAGNVPEKKLEQVLESLQS